MESSLVAKPYSSALLEIAKQDNSQSNWSDFLDAFANITADDETKDFLAHPKTNKKQKINFACKLLEQILEKKIDKKELSFVELVVKNDRTNEIGNIFKAFTASLVESNKGKVFKIFSAYKLDKAEEEMIIKNLAAKYNTTVNIEIIVDKSITGGIVIKEGDKVIDASIKAKIEALDACLSVN